MQGSAWFGEFKILRHISLELPMTMKLGISFGRSSNFMPARGSTITHMLKTETTDKGPMFHCFLYCFNVGLSESANLPITGMVHDAPGRWAFFVRYTICSRTRREMTTVRMVAVRVLLPCVSQVIGVV